MSVKRETSVSVTDLHNVTDHVKRLAISVDGHPAQSPPSSSSSPHASTAQEHQQQKLFDTAAEEGTAKDTAANGVAISSILSQAKTNFFTKYELLQEIGRGGFSTVHQCQDKDTGAMYAVKVVDLRPLRLRERFNPSRLRREVDIMRRLQHPNIIQFVDVYETTDQLMMVMEYCPGDELFDVILARKFFAETDAKIVFSQLCRALYYLHSLNIIHRDVKPENVLVLRHPDANGQVVCKLLDFGLSKNAGGGSAAKTFVGTPCYLAPEVEYTSKGLGGTYGLPADCWSLGAVLYVMLVARFPEFEQDLTGKVVLRLPPALWNDISSDAKDLIRSLMNTNPAARLTVAGALQHPWLGPFRASNEELSAVALACYDLGNGLQDEEILFATNERDERLMCVEEGQRAGGGPGEDVIMTATGALANQHQAMVLSNHHHHHVIHGIAHGIGLPTVNNGFSGSLGMGVNISGLGQVGHPEQLALRPLLHLQRSIAECFKEAHEAYAEIPEVAAQIRKGATLCRQQLMESTKMLRTVEQTAGAVLNMFPDLELAVEEGEPELAVGFFNMVRGWVVELRGLVKTTQEVNKQSMQQIQLIVEQSSMGLVEHHTSTNAMADQLSQRLSDMLTVQRRNLQAVTAAGTLDETSGSPSLTPDQLLELFLALFGQQMPGAVNRSLSNNLPLALRTTSNRSTPSTNNNQPVVQAVDSEDTLMDMILSSSSAHEGGGGGIPTSTAPTSTSSAINPQKARNNTNSNNTTTTTSVGITNTNNTSNKQLALAPDPKQSLIMHKNDSNETIEEFSGSSSSCNNSTSNSQAGDDGDDGDGDGGESMRVDTEDMPLTVALARSPQSSGASTRRGSHSSGNGNPHTSPSLDPTHPHHNTHSPSLNGDLSPSINALPLPINIANTLQKLLPSVTAAGKLSEALHKLRQIDLILEQLSVFWANTEVVLDVLTKKGQHMEQFIGFAHKPRLMARFRERMEEYKRFWEGINIMCSNYVQGVSQQPTNTNNHNNQGVPATTSHTTTNNNTHNNHNNTTSSNNNHNTSQKSNRATNMSSIDSEVSAHTLEYTTMSSAGPSSSSHPSSSSSSSSSSSIPDGISTIHNTHHNQINSNQTNNNNQNHNTSNNLNSGGDSSSSSRTSTTNKRPPTPTTPSLPPLHYQPSSSTNATAAANNNNTNSNHNNYQLYDFLDPMDAMSDPLSAGNIMTTDPISLLDRNDRSDSGGSGTLSVSSPARKWSDLSDQVMMMANTPGGTNTSPSSGRGSAQGPGLAQGIAQGSGLAMPLPLPLSPYMFHNGSNNNINNNNINNNNQGQGQGQSQGGQSQKSHKNPPHPPTTNN